MNANITQLKDAGSSDAQRGGITWRSGRRRRQPLLRLPGGGGGAATGPSDEALAVEDLEYAGHAAHLALEVPRVVVGQGGGGGAAHPGGHVDELSLSAARSGAERCRTIAGSHSGATTGVTRPAPGGATDGSRPEEEKVPRR